MDVLESALEARVFDYASFDFINNIQSFWTWVAVITAAVSLWSIRAVGSVSLQRKPDDSLSSGGRNVDKCPPVEVSTPAEASDEQSQACTWASSVCAVEDDGGTKGKFTVYYRIGGDDESTLSDFDGVCLDGEGFESWEGIWVRRGGDLGWYSHQDLMMLNGNVVRLWECDRRGKLAAGWVL